MYGSAYIGNTMHSAGNELQLLTTTDTKFKLVIQIVWRLVHLFACKIFIVSRWTFV